MDRPTPSPGLTRCLTLSLVAGTLLFACQTAAAAGAEDQLQQLLTKLPNAQVRCSAFIVDLESGRTLCDVNSRATVVPASNQKILILAAAIDRLGPDFRFETVLAKRGNDLVVIGSGDPALGDVQAAEMLGRQAHGLATEWAAALKVKGLSTIPGSLILDESMFDQQFTHPSWETDDLKKWYGAPIGALNYNDNCVDITINPGKPGSPVTWTSVPASNLLEVENRCKSGKGTPIIDRPAEDFRFVITGSCPKQWVFPPIAAPDPGLLMGSWLRTALEADGITITGPMTRSRLRLANGDLPTDCIEIARYVTPLQPVLMRIGKKSQNMFAECLAKRLGYEFVRRRSPENAVGSWQSASAALTDFLSTMDADASTAVIADASGLSRDNRLSAGHVVSVLRHMHTHPHRQLFVDSLSEAGEDGTLRKRMTNLGGKVYAKTGLLRGVRTLSGYVVTPSGKWRAFSIMFDSFTGSMAPYNKIHDQVCDILVAETLP